MYFFAAATDIEQARVDYGKTIWQAEAPKGFSLTFINKEIPATRYAHVARLDQDQQDWTSSLPVAISVSPASFTSEVDAMDALVVEMQSSGYQLIV
ncbi:MAG: hypothetical protein ACKPB3_10785 [Bacteroidota bacterium]